MIKIISFNVNGIKSAIGKGLVSFIEKAGADIICLQETKSPKDRPDLSLKGYEQFWYDAEKAGYSGTAVFTQRKPLKVTYGVGIDKHDHEGRVITVEFSEFFLVNVYVPNSKRELERLDYRVKEWDVDFLKYLKKLEKKRPVIFCGDLNVAHTELDLTNPKGNVKNHGFTPQERSGFENMIKAGFVDTFRLFTKEGGHYTWWSPMNNCRARNIGWRIDYFCVSGGFSRRVISSKILKDVIGSDHCPVELTVK
ncbi:MAG: exodeoxyribonuclease III [Candidatus Omnitrophota bacterium]